MIKHLKKTSFNRQSIFVHLFVAFVSSSLLIIIVTGFLYYEYTRQVTEQRVKEQVEYELEHSTVLFELGYQLPIHNHLKILSNTPTINKFLTYSHEQSFALRFDIEKQFLQQLNSNPKLYRSIRFIDASGINRIVKEGNKTLPSSTPNPFYSEDHSLQPTLKDFFEKLKQEQPQHIIFSQPVKLKDGRFVFYAGIIKLNPNIGGFAGALIIECDLSSYIKALNTIHIYDFPVAWLVSPKGEILAQPKLKSAQNHPLFDSIVHSSTKGGSTTRHKLYPGQHHDEEPFLIVVLNIPKEIFHKQNFNILKTILFIVLLAILFTLLVAWAVSRKITQPITELVRMSQNLANGDYSTRSSLSDNNEIGELSISFNHMAETLEQSIQSLDHQLNSRITAEQALQQSHESLQLILNSTGEGIFGIDTKGQCTFCNTSMLKLLGYKKEQDLVGKNLHQLIQHHSEDGQIYPQEDSSIIQSIQSKQPVHTDNEVFWRADNSCVAVEIRAHSVQQEGNTVGAVISFSDISDRKEQEQKITYQAHYDTLTGLPNRFLAMDRLTQLLSNVERNKNMAAVLFIDLDGFKKVNDMLGHEVGDMLLVESAQRFKACIRKMDTVGRLGGDEFIILLSDLKQQLDASSVVESILQTFRKPFYIQGHELLLTTSIGVAICPDDSKDHKELLRNADIAMYEAKQSGRNTYHFFTEELNNNIQRHFDLEEQLHHGLQKKEFYLVYQPIVDIQSMIVYGAEVLLRWKNDKLGMVGPDEFIPITEQTGLISSIGDYILNEAIEQTALWQKKYHRPFKLSVNVSPRQLHNKGLLDFISKLVNKHHLNAHSLQIELTEGVLMSQNIAIKQVLESMRESQIKIAMDDFGTGYSSLSYLRNYTFDSLKIDQTFVRDLHQDKNDRALIMATLDMSHALGVRVVAEGIETNEQLQFLIQAGCEYGQGYFFSKPVSAGEFEDKFLKVALTQYL